MASSTVLSSTSALTLIETEHGRMRRQQRGIDKKNLKQALAYGEWRPSHPRPNGDPTRIYTYKDITYVVNIRTMEEVTCYANPIQLDYVPVSAAAVATHNKHVERIKKNLTEWKSNTVIVVDSSGSMKSCDVWGTKTRLDAVWLSLALDFLADRLENGGAGRWDVISVVSLGPQATTLIHEEPSSWVLYNKMVRIYNEKLHEPRGHGPFLPALNKAERLLMRNKNSSCAMALVFLSDGRPSDAAMNTNRTRLEWEDRIAERVARLAQGFGRRLSFTAIGIGSETDYQCLNKMVEAAEDFGARASFRLPSLSSTDIGLTFTSISDTLTSLQTEMTDVDTLKQRQVRDMLRESKKVAQQHIESVSPLDFWIYPASRVRRKVYTEEIVHNFRKKQYWVVPLQHPDAEYVAFAKRPFGEGAERFAFRFYELGADARTIVGPPLVAKESRHVTSEEEDIGYQGETKTRSVREKFVRTFCETQQLALRLAAEFNEKLSKTHRAHPDTPRVSFLDCSIYEIDDVNSGKQSVLVEERLDETLGSRVSLWKRGSTRRSGINGMQTMDMLMVGVYQSTLKIVFRRLFGS